MCLSNSKSKKSTCQLLVMSDRLPLTRLRRNSTPYNLRSECDGVYCHEEHSHGRRARSASARRSSRRRDSRTGTGTSRRRAYSVGASRRRSLQSRKSSRPASRSRTSSRHSTTTTTTTSSSSSAESTDSSEWMESPPPSSSSRSSSRSGTRSSRSVRSRSHRSTRPRQSGSCSFRLYSSRGSQSPSPRARSSTPASSHNRSMTFPSSGTRSVTFDESANSRTSYTPTSRSSRSLSPWRHEERVSISPPPPSASRSDHTARSLSPEVITARSLSPAPSSSDRRVDFLKQLQLVVKTELRVKSVTLLALDKDGRLVVDSQLLVVPKEVTELEMEWQKVELERDPTVVTREFKDSGEEMELLKWELRTSTSCLFFRRQSRLSLLGHAPVSSSFPVPRICPVSFGQSDGCLRARDYYCSRRTPDAVSRADMTVFSFGASPRSDQVQPDPKIVVPPERADAPFYLEESVQLRGRNLEVHRKMLLKRELWTKGSGWKEKICCDYYLRPDFVLPPSCPPPTAAPPSTGQLPQRRLSDTISVSPQPATLDDRRLQQHSFTTNTPAASSPPPVKSKSSSSKSGSKGKSPGTKRSLLKKAFKGTVSSVDVDKPGLGQMRVIPSREIAINAPYNLAKVVQMELKNEHGKPLAWALKTNAMERFNAQPRNGILEPGERRKVTLNFNGTVSDPPPTDRIDIIWVDALPGSTFSMDLFFRDGITTGKRVLPVKYNEYSLFPIQGKN